MKPLRSPLILILFLAWLGAVTVVPVMGMNATWIVITGVVMMSSLLLLRGEDGIFKLKHLSLVAAWFWTHVIFVVLPPLFPIQSKPGNNPKPSSLPVFLCSPLVAGG